MWNGMHPEKDRLSLACGMMKTDITTQNLGQETKWTQQHKGLVERAETHIFSPFAHTYTEGPQGPVWEENVMLGWTQSSILGHRLVPVLTQTKVHLTLAKNIIVEDSLQVAC